MSEHFCTEHNVAYKQYHKKDADGNPYGDGWWAHPIEGGGWCNEKKKSSKPAPSPQAPAGHGYFTPDQQLRKYTLDKAHQAYSVKSPDEISSDGILALARKYEEYIKNG